jgi:mono/diheme cytochrome c family protein
VPTLTGADERFRRDWMVEYLQSPHDVRPRLESTMPRLSMSEEDAKLVAAYFVPDENPHATVNLDDADPEAGRALMNAENCGFCHSFGGTDPLTAS